MLRPTETLLSILLWLCTVSLPAQVQVCLDMTVTDDAPLGVERGVYDQNQKWTNGSTLNVKFIGGDEYVRSKVKYYAVFWENYANIKFNFSQSASPHILISFVNGAGSWSYVGAYSAKVAAQGNPSMNFGWFNSSTSESEFKRTTLHEFGHALGLLHEHRNANNTIQWNLPVVYNYYQQQGWSKDKVNEQVLGRYSVSLTNRQYDPLSIMHYPIPKEHTLNGYSVGWNTNISAKDIELMKEIYPKSGTVITNPDTSTNTGTVSSVLEDVQVDYNAYEKGVRGMKIYSTFTIANAKGKSCLLAVYFYTADGKALNDYNGKYSDAGGKVAHSSSMVPIYSNSRFTRKELFIPYDELHMDNGNHKLKFKLIIWDHNRKQVIQSGSYYFDYSNGVSSSNVQALVSYDNQNSRMVIMPKFTIQNAKGKSCQACVYFYNSNETPMLGSNGKQVAFCQSFTPSYATTLYNNDYYSDLYIYVPYSSIQIPNGTHTIKYFVNIFNGQETVGKSGWSKATFTQ